MMPVGDDTAGPKQRRGEFLQHIATFFINGVLFLLCFRRFSNQGNLGYKSFFRNDLGLMIPRHSGAAHERSG
jgi:hypothetical protein